ncbi:MAG: DUF1972 domain-containing protein [Acidobacteria bacterium]|nr:DUF1972 domain-containing protein [Acidobacteriota bacterium]
MRIAILGTRGIPANYGGFETFAEECASRLAARGHEVTVYGRSHYVPRHLRSHRGVAVAVLPTVPLKYTDTVVHTLLSVFHTLPRGFDVILICNAANSYVAWLPRLAGARVVVNVDGIERLRRKWNRLGRFWYRLSEYFSVWFPHEIVTDARCIESYYRERYGVRSEFIPYGTTTERPASDTQLRRLGLASRDYFLYVSRLEPENNAHQVVRAFERTSTSKRLVVVGDAPYSRKYIRELKRTPDPRILFAGAIYGDGYRQLMAGAFCYIHATEVGGSHPALIEAMGQGNLIVANSTPENEEVLGGCGILYAHNDIDDLAGRMQDIIDNPQNYSGFGPAARARAVSEYSWEAVVDRYERLFERLVAETSPAHG